ncbi:carbonic anhydrase, partial [Salmonella sp. s57402]|uniref:carbonic anhydrase n=1 Tax=Salmonella sp. s57402 TaxID=3159695 RepID=UPI00397FC356
MERRIDVDPNNPINIIRNGFHHFKTNEYDKHPERFEELKHGQSPKFLVFACSDSRVCPSRVLDFKPGEAFMTRNIANMVPEFNQLRYSGVGAVIEYAVGTLGVENIVVIGHSRCGGIEALMKLDEHEPLPTDFVHDWIKIGLPAKRQVLMDFPDKPFEEQCQICEREAVNVSLNNLLTYPYVKTRVEERKLKLMGGHYDFVA